MKQSLCYYRAQRTTHNATPFITLKTGLNKLPLRARGWPPSGERVNLRVRRARMCGGGGIHAVEVMMNMRAAKVSDHWQQNTNYPKKKLPGLKSPNTFQGQSFSIHDSTPPGGGGDNVTTCEGWHLVNDARVSTKIQKNVPQRVHTDLKRRLWLWDRVVKCQRCSVLYFTSVWVTVLEKEKRKQTRSPWPWPLAPNDWLWS